MNQHSSFAQIIERMARSGIRKSVNPADVLTLYRDDLCHIVTVQTVLSPTSKPVEDGKKLVEWASGDGMKLLGAEVIRLAFIEGISSIAVSGADANCGFNLLTSQYVMALSVIVTGTKKGT